MNSKDVKVIARTGETLQDCHVNDETKEVEEVWSKAVVWTYLQTSVKDLQDKDAPVYNCHFEIITRKNMVGADHYHYSKAVFAMGRYDMIAGEAVTVLLDRAKLLESKVSMVTADSLSPFVQNLYERQG